MCGRYVSPDESAIEREFKGLEKTNEPNKYYLRGYEAFGLSARPKAA